MQLLGEDAGRRGRAIAVCSSSSVEVHRRPPTSVRRARGMPRPNRAMRSRWTSLTPPPKVRISVPWMRPLDAAGEDGAGRAPCAACAAWPSTSGEQPVGLGEELGAEDLGRAGVGRVDGCRRPRGGHLPVDEGQELELGPDPGQVDLRPTPGRSTRRPSAQLGLLGPARRSSS